MKLDNGSVRVYDDADFDDDRLLKVKVSRVITAQANPLWWGCAVYRTDLPSLSSRVMMILKLGRRIAVKFNN